MESPSSTILFLLLFTVPLTLSKATTFLILNNCPFTVWAAAVPGGGRQLDQGQSWTLQNVSSSTTGGRIWARTGCSFDENGRGRCQSGDCGGLLECQGYSTPPNTMAEFALGQFQNLDFFDISLIDGFNLPMDFSPAAASRSCREIRCAADIMAGCPEELRAPGGCNGPCPVFKTNEYCCTSPSDTCQPTNYSMFFKNSCPDAYSYPKDDQTSTFTCPSGTDYRIVFCPSGSVLPYELSTGFGRVAVRLVIPEI